VQAFNGHGISALSGTGPGTTNLVALVPPVNVRLLGIKGSQVTLGWDDTNAARESFVIERQEVSPNPGPFVLVATVAAGTTQTGYSYTDKTARKNRTYLYRIAAVLGVNQSPWATVQVTVR